MQETQTPDSIRDVAFIGTGLMGVPMVHRLLGAGLAVRVWNRTSNKLEPLLAAGAVRAASPAEAAQGADPRLLVSRQRLRNRDRAVRRERRRFGSEPRAPAG